MTSTATKDVLTECLQAVKRDILSVGSGDGSQQAGMVKEGLKRLQVTFYDSRNVVLLKYPHCKENLDYLQKECITSPRFQVDATKIDIIYQPGSFDLIFFTFPHTGVPNSDRSNVSSNQALLRGFLNAASKLLRPEGEIQVTLKNGQHYDQWKLPQLLDETAGIQLQSTHNFEPKLFPGYKHRLTNGANGAMKVVHDKHGAKGHVFTKKSDRHSKSSNSPFAGKMITIVQQADQGWNDQELWAEVVAVLRMFGPSPKNVLEIRRRLDPTPDTRQLNRVLYTMERERIVGRHSPSSSTMSQKPRWSLI